MVKTNPAVFIVCVLLFVAVYEMAVYAASQHYRQQQIEDFPAYPRTRVWLNPVAIEAGERIQQLREALPQGCHRLLLQNQDKLFLFQPPTNPSQARLARFAVVEVPLASVQVIRVLPQYGSCGG